MRGLLNRLLVASAAACLVLAGLTSSDVSLAIDVPSGATPVPVTAGVTHSGIDASMHPGGAIVGHVRLQSAAGSAENVQVRAIPIGGVPTHGSLAYGWIQAGSNGGYRLRGLPAGDYYVCAYTFSWLWPAYISQCLGTTSPPNGDSASRGATPVHVDTGKSTTVNLTLLKGGVISGSVRALNGWHPLLLQNVRVRIYHLGRMVGLARSSANGTYRVIGLPPASDYKACFDTTISVRAVGGHTAPTGYASQCWRNAPWRPGQPPQANASQVRVRLGATTRNVDAMLPRAGMIAGSVRASTGTRPPIKDHPVVVYWAGLRVTTVYTKTNGAFAVRGLRAGRLYTVCTFAGDVGHSIYPGQCWKGIPWNGGPVPVGAHSVAVAARQTTRVDLLLGPGHIIHPVPVGTVEGKVTYNGQPAFYAFVLVFRNGKYVPWTEYSHIEPTTESDGSYYLNLPASPSYQICFEPDNEENNTGPTGYTGSCYGGGAWVGEQLPAEARTFAVQAGAITTAIDGHLGLGGAISGTVTHNGHPVYGVDVLAFNRAGQLRGEATARDGAYKVLGLPPSDHGYTVCFSPSEYADSAGDLRLTGLLGQCYQDQPWNAIWWGSI